MCIRDSGGGAVDADVMASFYDQAAGTWSATQTIAIPDTGDDLPITGLAADLDLAGNAIILYEQNSDDSDLDGDGDAETGAEEDILFSRFLNTGAAPVWSAPITLDFDPSDATGVTVEIEETTGDAILVWVQDNAVVDWVRFKNFVYWRCHLKQSQMQRLTRCNSVLMVIPLKYRLLSV